MKYWFPIVAFFLAALPVGASSSQHYENLRNPTEYIFSASSAKILEILRKVHGSESWGPLAGAFFEEENVYKMNVFNFYTTRYWTGRQETDEEAHPSEAGRIGTIQADFEVHLVFKSASQTLVSVTVKNFEQQVGRRYRIFPHFHKGPVFEDVKSDTYFEYLFLLRLGELLGEKNMPPIKGKP